MYFMIILCTCSSLNLVRKKTKQHLKRFEYLHTVIYTHFTFAFTRLQSVRWMFFLFLHTNLVKLTEIIQLIEVQRLMHQASFLP